MALDQAKLLDLKRRRAAFLAFGMRTAASGCDAEIARLRAAAEVDDSASEPPADEATADTPVVEAAVAPEPVRRRPRRS